MEDLVGKTFGFLTVIGLHSASRNGLGGTWVCKCECGITRVMPGRVLKVARPHNCGCKTPELLRKRAVTHGMAGSKERAPEYRSWYAMKQRCLNPKSKQYGSYGGRGIKICQEWIDSFEKFFEVMGPAPKGFELDRKDVDGDYEPDNCKWSSHKDQQRNKQNTVWVEFEGKTVALVSWQRSLDCHALGCTRDGNEDYLSKSV